VAQCSNQVDDKGLIPGRIIGYILDG